MRIFTKLEEYKPQYSSIAFTIGNFDGVHLGHLALLDYARKKVGLLGEVVVFTFRNHPSEVIRPNQPLVPKLCTIEQKLRLLEEAGVDTTILTSFTTELAVMDANSFISYIREWVPFTHLVLGYNATLGKDREGTREKLVEIAKEYHFSVDYMPEFRVNGEVVSSSRIRELIKQGRVEEAGLLLLGK